MSTIQLRRGTAAEATSNNPTLAAGEVGVETDTGRFKIGDGSTAWNSLPYSQDLTALSGSDGDLVALDGSGGLKVVGNGTYKQPFPMKSGLLYAGSDRNGTRNVTLTQDELILVPFWLPANQSLDQMAMWVQTAAASSSFRPGVYADDGSGYPGDLLFEAATPFDTSTANGKSTSISETASGLVWVGGVAQGGAPLVRGFHGSDSAVAGVGLSTISFIAGVGYKQTGVTGALPATFTTTKLTATTAPTVYLRAA